MVDDSRAADGDAAATIAAGVVEQSGHQHAVRAQQVSLASRCPRFVAIVRLDRALRASWISLSRNQRYRLTQAGRDYLDQAQQAR